MNLLDLMVKIGVDDQASNKIGGVAQNITGKLGSAAKKVGAFMAGVGAAAGAGVVAIGKSAVESYASYEQLVGGVDKLYQGASGKLQQYAQNAYKTAQMSANDYMEQATLFSAALINSLGGDVDKAADQTDKAMRLMSDNVNTFGSNAEDVQNAIQGLSRENFTMIDNLKLGYAGTREGMKKLIQDANDYAGLTGTNNELTIDSFSDMIDAIDIIQQKQHIWGTTAKEASTTIEGSVNMTKAAWENFLTSLGTGNESQIRTAVGGIVSGVFGTWDDESGKRVGGIINNVAPVIQRVGAAMLAELPSLASTVARSFLEWLSVSFGNGDTDWIDELFNDVQDFAQRAGKAIGDFADAFKNTFKSDEFVNAFEHIKSAAGKVFDFITENADVFGAAFGVAVDVFGAVADAIATVIDVLGPFVPAIAGAVGALALLGPISGIVGTLSGAFTFFTTVIVPAMGMVQSFGGAITLLTTLLGGPIPILVAIVGAIVVFIATNEDARKTLLKAWNAVMNFFKGIPKLWNNVWDAVTDTLKKTVSKAIEMWQELKSNATSKFNEIKNNMAEAASAAKDNVVQAFQNLKDGASQKIGDLIGYVKKLPSNIKSAIGNLASAMQQKGRDIIDGIKNGVVNRWDNLRAWLAGIPSRVLSSIGSVAGTLAQKGRDIISGLKSGLTGAWGSVSGWVSGIPTRIKNALGGVGSLLSSAGSSIINGLKSGMVSAFKNVKKWVSGVAGTIRRLKGPLDYDKTVLIDNGEALMYGLQKGLSTSFEGKVKPYVKSMAGEMSDAFNVAAPSLTAAGAVGAGGQSVVYNVYIDGDALGVNNRIASALGVLVDAVEQSHGMGRA